MSNLIKAIDTAIEQSQLVIQGYQTTSAKEFQTLYQDPKADKPHLNRLFDLSKLRVSDQAIEKVSKELCEDLKPYIDSQNNTIGIGLRFIVGGQYVIPISMLSSDLIEASIKLGSNTVVDHLNFWKNNNTIEFNSIATITSVVTDKVVETSEGIAISPSNHFSDEQIGIFGKPNLPEQKHRIIMEYCSKLSLKTQGIPALFLPNSKYKGEVIFLDNKIPNICIDSFCRSLSLICKGYIKPIVKWQEVGELEAYYGNRGWSIPVSTSRTFHQKIKICETDLTKACKVHNQINKMCIMSNKMNIFAIDRWIEASRRESNRNDKFVNLRTALESLYISGENTGEIRFKLAIRCAWHLGGDLLPEARKKIFNDITEFYKLSSKLVHGSKINDIRNAKELFQKALNYCHEGIMKILSSGTVPKWDEIIFG